ncbi:MAG: hypothetical protein INR71_13280 [Terriglobus roseus]|nr:hypothetical protein [Terriglobus roseus]
MALRRRKHDNSQWLKSYVSSATPGASQPLPAKLRCGACNKHKATAANFSGKQLAGLREQVAQRGQAAAQTYEVVCIACASGGQNVEMTCVDCHRTMGLEAFAKAHRKDRDNAKCLKCMEKRVALKTVGEVELGLRFGERDEQAGLDAYYYCESEDGGSSFDASSLTGGASESGVSSSSLSSRSSMSRWAGSTEYTSGSLNSTGASEGGIEVHDADAWVNAKPGQRSVPIRSTAGSARGTSLNAAYGSGVTLSSNSSKTGATPIAYASRMPPPALRPPPSVADSALSDDTLDTETGSRARFPRIARAVSRGMARRWDERVWAN